MLKTIKLSVPEDKLFFYSDAHIGHDKNFILEPRGFKNVTEHDEGIIERWNSVVDNESTIFHLGDLILKSDEAGFWNLLRRLNFRHIYIGLGNHFSGHRQAYLGQLLVQFPTVSAAGSEVYPLDVSFEGRKVTFLPEYAEVSAAKTDIVLCHYPLISHHGQGRGSYLLAGHCHHNEPITNKNTGQGRRLDVGVESVGKPVSLREVKAILKDRDLDVRDHHHS